MSNYWAERMAESQQIIADKTAGQIEGQLARYYKRTMEQTIKDFTTTYEKVLAQIAEGKNPSPALLYNLSSYWEAQGALKNELMKLGDKEVELLSKQFEATFRKIYEETALPITEVFSPIEFSNIKQFTNQIWCADGKSWSERIWSNTEKLQQLLNDNLQNCVLTGKKPSELAALLREQFNVGFYNSNMIVRTELAHIQNQAALERYKSYGVSKVEILAEDGCEHCQELADKVYEIAEAPVVPIHPNCRCCIVPVIE